MNRKQRRASRKQSPSSGPDGFAADNPVQRLFAEAKSYQQQQKLDDAARIYRRLLLLDPDNAQANNDFACLLQTQGKRREASEHFTRALTLMPQLFDAFSGVCATLAAVLPPVGEAMRRAAAAWPKPVPVDQLLAGTGLAGIADNPLLLSILQTTPVREFALERVLTLLRISLLADAAAGKQVEDSVLTFCCALAEQCFINEYVFAVTADEDAQVDLLKRAISQAVATNADVAPLALAALAMFAPLHVLTGAQTLLTRHWPDAVERLLTQQVREPLEECALRAKIPRLNEIDDATSQRVREQYEESPYPRWVRVAGNVEPVNIERYLREVFPAGAISPRVNSETLDVLVAGCGTGWQAIGVVQKFIGARVFAVDLSLSSLSYAIRKTPPEFANRIDYAQADILKLGSIGRTFDLIEASGVLHHMADPFAAWSILVTLLRPSGLMHIGLYSELARRQVVAVRSFIADRGYGHTPVEIRRCRQELIDTPMRGVARFNDFFTTSECRDLLFHVQETRVGIPAIEGFFKSHDLRFLGFEFDAASMTKYRTLFAEKGWSLTDFGRWHELETAYPDTFANMYQIWAQKK